MVLSALKNVFKKRRYLVFAVVIAVIAFVIATWLQNLRLIILIIGSQANFLEKLNILIGLVGSITTNFTVFSAVYTIIIAILFGINVSMLVYFVRKRREMVRSGSATAVGAGGVISGMFGIGCAACGTLVLGPLLSLVGASGLIALLPFGGQEFGVLGVGMLGFSIFLTAKKIQDPLVCDIKQDK